MSFSCWSWWGHLDFQTTLHPRQVKSIPTVSTILGFSDCVISYFWWGDFHESSSKYFIFRNPSDDVTHMEFLTGTQITTHNMVASMRSTRFGHASPIHMFYVTLVDNCCSKCMWHWLIPTWLTRSIAYSSLLNMVACVHCFHKISATKLK